MVRPLIVEHSLELVAVDEMRGIAPAMSYTVVETGLSTNIAYSVSSSESNANTPGPVAGNVTWNAWTSAVTAGAVVSRAVPAVIGMNGPFARTSQPCFWISTAGPPPPPHAARLAST